VIYRIYPTKDTFITNDVRDWSGNRFTGSNVGFSEELDVFKRPGVSGTIGVRATASLGRILIQFDLSAYAALTASGDIPVSGSTYRLRLAHKTSAEPLPYGFTLETVPVSSSWDEGRGMDVNDLGDNFAANWMKRTASQYWTAEGGDFLPSPAPTAYFDTGAEDVDLDITSLVEGWISGTYQNNGLAVKMTTAEELNTDYTDLYVKKFYSRHSSWTDRVPYVEVRVNDYRADDRINMRWGRSGSLFLYNVVGGTLTDLEAGQVVVSVADASGVLLYATASHGTTPGIYSASFALGSGSYSGSLFYDRWRVGARSLTTGSFTFRSNAPVNTLPQGSLIAKVRNVQDEYQPEDAPRLEVMFRRRPTTLPVVLTASQSPTVQIQERAWYAVENDATRERVIPFGTGSQQHTRLSYDANGNYFRLFMNNFHAGNVYRVVLLVDENGRREVIDPGIRFKVV
jgi:hypothetical protein